MEIFKNKYILSIILIFFTFFGVLQASNSPKKLGIYYSFPSYLNSSVNQYDIKKVVNNFNNFDIIVLGAGVENKNHQDNANTLKILKGSKTTKAYKGTSYGYITLKNSSGSEIKSKIDNWKSMGAKGVFFDEAGYDYLVPNIKKNKKSARLYQNEMIDYAHSKGLKVMINAFNPDDIFGVKYLEAKTKLKKGDSYLFEGFTYNTSVKGYYDFDNQKSKISSLSDYKKKFNINVYCVGIFNNKIEITNDKIETFYKNSLGNCDAIQVTEVKFSSYDGILNNYFRNY